jgi:hypothetical protein
VNCWFLKEKPDKKIQEIARSSENRWHQLNLIEMDLEIDKKYYEIGLNFY